MKKMCSTRDMSRADWLEWRKHGIGGSDAAALIGLSHWASPFSVYLDKIGLAAEKPDSEAMRQGRDLEAYVAQRFCEQTGKSVRRCNAMMQHSEYDFIIANVDRLVVGEKSGLECKTMSVRSPAYPKLENGDVPEQYYVQCQHYMMVTGLKKWYLAILVLGDGFYCFEIDWEQREQDALLQAEVDFWQNHVLPRIPPAPDGSDACTAALRALHMQDDGSEIDLPEAVDTVKRLEEIRQTVQELNDEKQMLENTLKAKIGAAAIAHVPGFRLTHKTQTRTSWDMKGLQNDYPAFDWDKYKKTSTYRVLRIKEDA